MKCIREEGFEDHTTRLKLYWAKNLIGVEIKGRVRSLGRERKIFVERDERMKNEISPQP